MTLSNSKYNRYDIGERLTVDDPTIMKGPLQLAENKRERNDEYSAASATKSNISNNNISDASSPTSTASPPRSIFSAYWKTDTKLSPSSSSSPTSTLLEGEQGGRHRRQQTTSSKTYAYNHDQDPYKYFGISEEVETESYDDDDDSLNSYERMLRKSEETTTTMRGRSSTCPSLSAAFESRRMVINSNKKTTQSDTVLFAKASKRLSCLRKSRFSIDCDKGRKEYQRSSSSVSSASAATSVSFESRIEVHLFHPPVEKWAPSGWSSWFGV